VGKQPVLASDEDGDTIGRLGFSLASDIVELVILTTDDTFLQTLREAVGSARRLWHVPSADKVSDLLLAGQVGILVLDVQALHEAANVFVSQIKRQFPDLVIVVAGNRDAENSLASLISAGLVYRFIHKPMSPGRAKLFTDAAVKRYDEQRKRVAATPGVAGISPRKRRLVTAAAIGVLAAVIAATWAVQRGLSGHGTAQEGIPQQAETDQTGTEQMTIAGKPALTESPSLARAAAALADNRLTAPSGDNALELYGRELVRNPLDPAARAGLAEVHERLLARAENALLEERLDEAATAIETARRAGVDSGRIAFLNAQLAKTRGQLKVAAQGRPKSDAPPASADGDKDLLTRTLSLAAERMQERRLAGPDEDNARFYVLEALRIDPNSDAAQASEEALAIALLSEAHIAVERRDFTQAASLLEAATGIASPTNVENLQRLLETSRKQTESDIRAQLLKTAQDRLQQDRLIEPANDSAKYYLLTLRGLEPSNVGLAAALQDLGAKLVAKGRRALGLQQYDAARDWLDEAANIGFSSVDSAAALRDLNTAANRQSLLTNIVAAGELTLIKSVQPVYPRKAQLAQTEGWVELDFTVAESGAVKDIAVHQANPSAVFDDAAIHALSQWRYLPILRGAKPTEQRARIRIRFTLSG
jgi:TonB family protein